MSLGKQALIIGGGGGIGSAVARRLAADGFDLVVSCSHDVSRLDGLRKSVEDLGRNFHALEFRVEDRTAAAEALLGIFGDSAPEAVIYNAGIARDNLFVFMSGEEWDSVIRTNLDGFYNSVQPLLMGMMAKRSGRIVVISSASGQAGQAGQVNYSASKAALIGAVKALAREIGRKGILVNAVAPGFIETAMTAELPKEKILPMIPLNRAGTPEEVAGAVSFLCGPDSRYVHGQVLAVNGGLVI